MSVMQKCIPKRIVPVDRPTPWIDRDIQHDIRLRERLYKRLKASKCQDWLVKYKAVCNWVVSKIRLAKQAFFQSLCSTRNSPKKFWSAMWSLKPNKSPLSTALFTGSITATSAVDKANLLNNFLHLVLTIMLMPFHPMIQSLFPISSLIIWISQLTKWGSSCVEHTLTLPLVLISLQPGCWVPSQKSLPPPLHQRLTTLKFGEIPKTWKHSNIVPIPKEANRFEVRFFWPISLLPIILATLFTNT